MRHWLIAACLLASLSPTTHGQIGDPKRQTIGVAFGGGSALGFAHVGVIRWFEEHHIPIDRVAGTSMGGLIGGAYATGMSAAELTRLIETTDWDDVFGATPYRYKSIPRKEDARNYPSRLVLHMRRGVGLPSWLNNGAEVDALLSSIGAIYAGLPSFDSLPTPFRCVALDLQTGEAVVLDRGSLPLAMRATMSIPGVFPPIQIGDRTLVDGGAIDNVPADVAKDMGADVVIAIPVGAMGDTSVAAFSLVGVVQGTVEAMTGANTRRGMKQADIVINPKLTEFSGRDWRKGKALIEEGYRTAEAMKTRLLELSVDSATWVAYLADRAARRRTRMPVIAAIEVSGATAGDERLIRRKLRHHVGRPLDIARVEADVRELSGLDRYLTVGWDLVERDAGFALLVRARRLPSAPFLMTTVTVQNRTSDEYVFQWASRLLAFDVLTYGSELRLDVALGANASGGAELRQPIAGGPLFVALSAIGAHERVNFALSDAIVSQYDNQRLFGQLDIGVMLWRDAEIRAGVRAGYRDGDLHIGFPVLPSPSGAETELRVRGVLDTQDRAVVPSEGVRIVTTGRHVMDSPDPDLPFADERSNHGLYQAEIEGSGFLSWDKRRQRVFALAAGGSSFDGNPFPIDQFVLGLPLRLDAFWLGERRGDHFAALTLGYLREIGRFPYFIGGPTLAGAWLQGGSAFDDDADAHINAQLGIGTLSETLLGPALIGFSFGAGAQRFYVGFGRIFR